MKKMIFQKFRKFGKSFLMLKVFFFSKNKIFHGNLPEAGRFRELVHKQYILERFNQNA
jgi:hypothetical protein